MHGGTQHLSAEADAVSDAVTNAALQVCGEATYVDDMKMHGMLHAALVVSSRPHAKILSVDATAATRVSYIPLHTLLSRLHCPLLLEFSPSVMSHAIPSHASSPL